MHLEGLDYVELYLGRPTNSAVFRDLAAPARSFFGPPLCSRIPVGYEVSESA